MHAGGAVAESGGIGTDEASTDVVAAEGHLSARRRSTVAEEGCGGARGDLCSVRGLRLGENVRGRRRCSIIKT